MDKRGITKVFRTKSSLTFAIILLTGCLAHRAAADPLADTDEVQLSTPDASLPTAARTGWVSLNSSIIFYDAKGNIEQEIGLGTWDEDGDLGMRRRRIVRGGASSTGEFAWSWEKILVFPLGHEESRKVQSRTLHFWGSDGQEIWRDETANAPESMDPATLSRTGEHVLVIEGDANSGAAVLFDYLGNRLLQARGSGPAEFFTISPKGIFALVRWHKIDQPPTYTVLNTRDGMTRTIPSDAFFQGDIRVDDDGKIYVGSKPVFDVGVSSSSAPSQQASPRVTPSSLTGAQ